jgi:YVTN family beta-propeller protein
MSLKRWGVRAAMLAGVIGLVLFYTGCGDVFRPVANPEPLPGGDPQRSAHAVVVSSNGANQGTAVVIDLTGDSNAGTFSGETFGIGRSPVYAISSGGVDYVVNRDDNNIDSFSTPTVGIPLSLPVITLDAGAVPVFAAVAQGKVFVAESGLGTVVDITGNEQRILVGSTPVALVAPPSPNDTQLYSLNQGDNTVSVILPATDQNIATLTLPAGAKPVRAAASADGTRVFVVNQGTNSVSVIDTVANALIAPGPACPQDTFCVGTGPNYIFYEATLNRFYITNPADNSLSIINNNMDTRQCVAANPTPCLQTVSLAGPPCNGQHPVSVTALADGTKAYVADDVTNSVCVLHTTSNTFTTSIPVGIAPVFIISDPDSNRVLTANSGSFDVSLIQTSSDTTVKQGDGVTPLTICAGPTLPGSPCTLGFTPTFIAVTP